MEAFWTFLTNNSNPIDTLLKILMFLGIPVSAIFGAILWILRRWLRGRLRVDVRAFEIITDPVTLVPKIFNEENNPDILADHRIPYVPRDPTQDTQAQLRAALRKTRYLLIVAPTGLGKTREAATLAASLMNEDYRVVRVKMAGWLDVPKEFPPELGSDRRHILIILGDLNGLFSTGSSMQSPKAEQMPTLGQPSYHDRLLGFINKF